MSSCVCGWGKGFCVFALRGWPPCRRHRVGMRKGAELCCCLVSSFPVALALCFASPCCIFTVGSFPGGRLREEQLTEAAARGGAVAPHQTMPFNPCPAPLIPTLQWSPAVEPGAPFSCTSHGRGWDSTCKKRRQLLFSREIFPFAME